MYRSLCVLFLLMVVFYKYFKGWVVKYAPRIVSYLHLYTVGPAAHIVGAVELSVIASCHVFFAYLCGVIFQIHWRDLGFSNFTGLTLLQGALLGIGGMGVSTLLCRFMMEVLPLLLPQGVPNHFSSWITIARGGWMRRHVHSMEMFSFIFAILILLMQVGAEEVIFRGILLHHFIIYGEGVAAFIAVIAFVWMQVFQMTNWVNATFPMVGALVMGCVHVYLYLKTNALLPLMVAHVTFFLFAVL